MAVEGRGNSRRLNSGEFKWGNMVGNVGKGKRSRKDKKVGWVGNGRNREGKEGIVKLRKRRILERYVEGWMGKGRVGNGKGWLGKGDNWK